MMHGACIKKIVRFIILQSVISNCNLPTAMIKPVRRAHWLRALVQTAERR